ncbi:ASKHA domain-containing protein [candidate division KSB1 bacterium]|nr:ASKHA domain-containing protein [candidate division KSB1 bacterium]
MINKDIVVIFQPEGRTIKVPTGTNLMAASQKAGIIIPGFCGNRGKCGKCKVKILEKQIPYTHQEEIILSPEERRAGVHLACQIPVSEKLIVEVISEEKATTTAFLTYDIANNYEIDHHIKKYYAALPVPDIDSLIDDSLNIAKQINTPGLCIPLPILQSISAFLRKNDFKITVTLEGDHLINLEAGDTSYRLFGVAIDLGTTTIVGSLVDMQSGNVLAVSARTNPQTSHGADVISRVNYSISEPGGLGKLQTLVINAINEIIEDLCETSGAKFREIYELSLAGNTIMNHLFLGVNPQYIAEAPYIPAYRKSQKFMAEELGIAMLPRGPVSTLPNISGYVGGDITGFILACDLDKREKITLGIDIGTNGEIVLGSNEKLLCCSTAAGPAFEGGQISCGMRAMEGAIDKFFIDEDRLFYHVIGDADAKGVCGTGLIDIAAEMIRVGIIDETGRICSPETFRGPEWLKKRIVKNNHNYDFMLVAEDDEGCKIPVRLKQQDIRELQLAKSAVAAGIEILAKELGITVDQIEEVLIAGAFGSYLNKYNAQRIGLIPNIAPEKIRFVGNAASMGAKKYLLSKSARNEAERIIETTQYIELSMRIDFQEIFAEKMFF